MFDDFTYRDYRVRAGVQQSRTDRLGRWYGVISLVEGPEQDVFLLEDHLFEWPAGARRYAVHQAKTLIDARRDAAATLR